ncbi:MAG: DinB family protein [Desulfobacterales bacterium]|jgi:hypothetical protein
MSQRAKELSGRFMNFNQKLIAFVEKCSDENWGKVCSGENWPVSVVARHIAAGHYSAIGLAQLIVEGKQLPELTSEIIDQGNAQHAKKHSNCTKDEVLGILREKGSSAAEYIAGLDDADLDRTSNLPLAGGNISAQQCIENIIINSGTEHLINMKSATGVR